MTNPTETHPKARDEVSSEPDVNMRPVTVFLGITMGTVSAVAIGLLLVCFLFWLLKGDYPRLNAEIPTLAIATAMFSCLSVLSSLSFYGSLKSRSWRHITMILLWVGVLLVGSYFWPA